MTRAKDQHIRLRATQRDVDDLDALALAWQLTRSEAVRRAVQQALRLAPTGGAR